MPRLRPWLPPLLWAGLILLASRDTFSIEQTGAYAHTLLGVEVPYWLHVTIRKVAHLTEYGILAVLTFRAAIGTMRKPASAVVTAVVFPLLIAIIDETHQSFTVSRRGSVGDVLLDLTGALCGVALLLLIRRRRGRRPTA